VVAVLLVVVGLVGPTTTNDIATMHGLKNPKSSFFLATFKEGAGCVFLRLSDMRQN
jgi:hypothetical protein